MRWQTDIPVVGDIRTREEFLWLPRTRYVRTPKGEIKSSETRWLERTIWEEEYTFRDGIHQWEILRFVDEGVLL